MVIESLTHSPFSRSPVARPPAPSTARHPPCTVSAAPSAPRAPSALRAAHAPRSVGAPAHFHCFLYGKCICQNSRSLWNAQCGAFKKLWVHVDPYLPVRRGAARRWAQLELNSPVELIDGIVIGPSESFVADDRRRVCVRTRAASGVRRAPPGPPTAASAAAAAASRNHSQVGERSLKIYLYEPNISIGLHMCVRACVYYIYIYMCVRLCIL